MCAKIFVLRASFVYKSKNTFAHSFVCMVAGRDCEGGRYQKCFHKPYIKPACALWDQYQPPLCNLKHRRRRRPDTNITFITTIDDRVREHYHKDFTVPLEDISRYVLQYCTAFFFVCPP